MEGLAQSLALTSGVNPTGREASYCSGKGSALVAPKVGRRGGRFHFADFFANARPVITTSAAQNTSGKNDIRLVSPCWYGIPRHRNS